jgi:transposase
MESSKQMSIEIKSKIITLSQENLSNCEISRRVGYSEGAVRNLLKKFQETGSIERKKGSGRGRVTSARDDRLIKKIVSRDRFLTAPEIHAEVQSTSTSTFSVKTVSRRLLEHGFQARSPAKKPLLTDKMKKARLDWAKEHQNWTLEDWKRVIFSDESKFNLFGPDGRKLVRRKPGERYHPKCVTRTVKHSPYVMIWGCMTAYGLGPLNFVQGTMNAIQYKKVLENHIIPTF